MTQNRQRKLIIEKLNLAAKELSEAAAICETLGWSGKCSMIRKAIDKVKVQLMKHEEAMRKNKEAAVDYYNLNKD